MSVFLPPTHTHTLGTPRSSPLQIEGAALLAPLSLWVSNGGLSPQQMIRMSTGHMEGNLQLLYLLLTDCYMYLIRKGIIPPWKEGPLGCQLPCSGWEPPLEQAVGSPGESPTA